MSEIVLKTIASDYETIAEIRRIEYGASITRFIVPKETPLDHIDIATCIEDTFHRIFDAGGNGDDILRILGARIPDKEEMAVLEKYGEHIPVDKGYVIPGVFCPGTLRYVEPGGEVI